MQKANNIFLDLFYSVLICLFVSIEIIDQVWLIYLNVH